MARRKILFCDNSLRELLNFRKEIICHYASNGYNVVLVAPQNMDIYQWELPNIRFVPIIMNRSGTNPIEDLKYFFRLKRIYAKEKPDYIFHYTIKPNIYGTFAARSCGIRSSAMIAGLGYVCYTTKVILNMWKLRGLSGPDTPIRNFNYWVILIRLTPKLSRKLS